MRFAIFYGRDDFIDTMDALAAGSLPLNGLISEVISLEELPDRFAYLGRRADAGKVVVAP